MKNQEDKLKAQSGPKRKKPCGCGSSKRKQPISRRKLSR